MKKYTILLSLLMILGQFGRIAAMQGRFTGRVSMPYMKNVAQKGLARVKQSLSKTMTVSNMIHHGIATAPFLCFGVGTFLLNNYWNPLVEELSFDVEPEIQLFVDEVTPGNVPAKVKSSDFLPAGPIATKSKGKDYIIIPNLFPDFGTNENLLDAVAAGLQHEKGHIKHNDVNSRNFMIMTLPFITHCASKKAGVLLSKLLKYVPYMENKAVLSIKNEIGSQSIMRKCKNVIKNASIPTAFFKFFANIFGLTALFRHQEIRADDSVYDDLKYLEGLKLFLGESHDLPLHFGVKNRVTKRIVNLISTHPTNEERIARIDKRIEKLKNTEKKC